MAQSRIIEVEFNIRDRGRSLTGIERSRFDWQSACRVINNANTQEKAKHGDLFGYLGHAYRMAFGLDPQESSLTKLGMQVYEPAFLTRVIEANEQAGTVYHRTEICDTKEGDTVMRMNGRKHGGFSSVFSTKAMGAKDIAREFFGFDYVYLVNYSSNRSKVQSQAQMDSAAGAATKEMVMFGEGETVIYMDSCGSLNQFDSASMMRGLMLEQQDQFNAMLERFDEVAEQLGASRSQAADLMEQLDSAAVAMDSKNTELARFMRLARQGRSHLSLEQLTSRRQHQEPEKPKVSNAPKRDDSMLQGFISRNR